MRHVSLPVKLGMLVGAVVVDVPERKGVLCRERRLRAWREARPRGQQHGLVDDVVMLDGRGGIWSNGEE